jgi:hypothetical protein
VRDGDANTRVYNGRCNGDRGCVQVDFKIVRAVRPALRAVLWIRRQASTVLFDRLSERADQRNFDWQDTDCVMLPQQQAAALYFNRADSAEA